MNGPAKLERRARSSKEAAMSKAKVRNPLREVNGSVAAPRPPPPPPFGSSEIPRRGCFSFLLSNSSSREALQHSKSSFKTPASAPPVRRAAALENRRAKPSRCVNSQNAAPKCDPGASKKPGARKDPRPKAPELLQKWNRRNPGLKKEKVGKKCDLDDGSGGETGSCLASTPEKSVTLGFSGNVALLPAVQGEEKVAKTPGSAITPPIEASLSPEVPIGASAIAATPACFAAGHVLVGVHDRRKCRPRGILTIGGGFATEMTGVPSGASSTTPPIADASIQWLSPPPGSVNSGIESGHGSSSRVRLAHWAAEASMNWLVSPIADGDDACKEEIFEDEHFGRRFKSSADQELLRYSPSSCSARGSPKLHGQLLDLNLSPLATTPSSGINVQKTPTTGGSVSPFSIILKRVEKASKSKLVWPQQDQKEHCYGFTLESSQHSGESWINDNVICTPSTNSFSNKQLNLSPFETDEIEESLRNISLSLELAACDEYSQKPDQSFQFECTPIPLNSVDLDHFQKPSSEVLCVKHQNEASNGTRISWREGLVSRIFEMSDLEYSHWLSDKEENITYDEFYNLESVSHTKCGEKTSSSIPDYKNDQFMSDAFGSREFACLASVDKSEEKMPASGLNSCAESFSTDGLQSISSDDSHWTLFYKNHLFKE